MTDPTATASTNNVSWPAPTITVQPAGDIPPRIALLPNTTHAAVVSIDGYPLDVLAISATSPAMLPMLWRHARRAADARGFGYEESAEEKAHVRGKSLASAVTA